MPNLIEVGIDYLIRPFYVSQIGMYDYLEADSSVERPTELNRMISVVSMETKGSSGPRGIIDRVLRKSLLEPTAKTFFDHRMSKFVMVEPKIDLADLADWQAVEGF